MQCRVSLSTEIALSDFALLVAGMSRFLSGLAMIPPFAAGQIGLSEWVVLMELSQNDRLSNTQLAKSLGVSGQRINQIINSLAKSKLISVSTSQEDSRRNEIEMSPSGQIALEEFNKELTPLVADAFKDREHLISRLAKQTRRLVKFVAAAKLEMRRKIGST